ncbi:hypothetical protein NL676_010782 [Syzygium grande]|nr:hypothetical protein NL676_010782 [Syzygium grande]
MVCIPLHDPDLPRTILLETPLKNLILDTQGGRASPGPRGVFNYNLRTLVLILIALWKVLLALTPGGIIMTRRPNHGRT